MVRLIALLALLLPALAAAQSPVERLVQGRNAYLYGDYRLVIETLKPIAGQEEALFADAEEIVEAYELRGLSYFYLGQPDEARDVFEALVLYRPEKRLDPVRVPPPAVAFYEGIRAELKEEIRKRQEAIERKKAEEAELRKKESMVQVVVDRRRNSKLVAAVPFGVGQFQNGDDLLGGLFLGSELVAVALSATFLIASESLRQPDGLFTPQDVDQARSLRTAQLVSGGVAAALMVGGVVHALVTFRDEIEVKRTTIQPTVRPVVGPTGGGLGVGFSF
ncbi:MAG: tetratricopeptide repeat protein [Myxococcales bacterium]|nr:tetratricopeptide repeat protein [Myxococcales bacterium]